MKKGSSRVHRPVSGFIGYKDLQAEAVRRGFPKTSIRFLQRLVLSGKIVADQKEASYGSAGRVLFKEQRKEELLRLLQRQTLIPEHFSITAPWVSRAHQLDSRIREEHMTQFLAGAQSEAKLKPLTEQIIWVNHGKRLRAVIPDSLGEEFVRRAREKKLPARKSDWAKRRIQQINASLPSHLLNRVTILRRAQQIDPTIRTPHLNAFLQRSVRRARIDPEEAALWVGAYTVLPRHLQTTILPRVLGEQFLNWVRVRRLGGGRSGEKRGLVSSAPSREADFTMVPAWFNELGKTDKPRFSFFIVVARLKQMIPALSSNVREGLVASYMGIPVAQVKQLTQQGLLKTAHKGTITLQSIKKLFGFQ